MQLTDSTVLTEHVFTREISDHRANQTPQRDVHSVMQMENRLGSPLLYSILSSGSSIPKIMRLHS